jgi:hypothetical protein
VVLATVVVAGGGEGVVLATVVVAGGGEGVVDSVTCACDVEGSSPLPSVVMLSVDTVEAGSAPEQAKAYPRLHWASFQMGSEGCDECPTRTQNSLFLKLFG